MVEDYLHSQPDLVVPIVDPVEAVVADSVVAERVARVAARYSGGGVRRDDLEQELWVEVMRRVRRAYDPSRGDVRGFVLCSLRRWVRDARGRLRPSPVDSAPTDDPLVLESVPCPPCWQAKGLVDQDLGKLKDQLSPGDREHVEIRLSESDPRACADRLGITPRTERRRWRRILAELRTAAEERTVVVPLLGAR